MSSLLDDFDYDHPMCKYIKSVDNMLWVECELYLVNKSISWGCFEDDFAISEALDVLTEIVNGNLSIDTAFVQLMCIDGHITNREEAEALLRLLLSFIISVVNCNTLNTKTKKKQKTYTTKSKYKSPYIYTPHQK
eukprot:1011611_1